MNETLTVADAAKEIGVNSETIYNWHKSGKIRMIFVSKKVREVYRSDIDKMKLVINQKKSCKDCGETDPASGFEPNRNICKDCYSVYQKNKRLRNADKLAEYEKKKYAKNKGKIMANVSNWYEKNKDKVKIRNIAKKYNVTKQEYINMLEEANGVCQICQKVTTDLCVDHCHNTSKVRGLICALCNSGMGLLKDDVNIARSVVKYLQRYENLPDEDDSNCIYYYGAKRGALPKLTSNELVVSPLVN